MCISSTNQAMEDLSQGRSLGIVDRVHVHLRIPAAETELTSVESLHRNQTGIAAEAL